MASQYWSFQQKHNAVNHWMEQHFIPVGNGQSKIRISSGHKSTMASRSLWEAGTGKLACTHPSYATVEGLIPFLKRTDTVVGLSRCHMVHRFKQSKAAHVEYETGKDISTQGDKSRISYMDSLSIRKEEFRSQDPFLWGLLMVKILYAWDCPFQQLVIPCLCMCWQFTYHL